VNWCVDRSPQSVTVHVKVSDNLGTIFSGSGCDVVVFDSLLSGKEEAERLTVDSGEGGFVVVPSFRRGIEVEKGAFEEVANALGIEPVVTPSRKRNCTATLGGRLAWGVIRLRRAGGIPVLRNIREGSMAVTGC